MSGQLRRSYIYIPKDPEPLRLFRASTTVYSSSSTYPPSLHRFGAPLRRGDLRVVFKSSGHDFSGRSTAKNPLLLWTAHLRVITFTDHFIVNGVNQGSVVTVGSGVGLKYIYAAAKAENKIFVGGTAATVSAAGGYTQGAGHSAFSPIYGLASDNVLRTCFPFPSH